eukprot:4236552-Prymnesium_polylepis.1
MSSIIHAKSAQHEEMAETLIKYKDKHIAETVICDGFWDVELPKIYKSVGRMLYEQGLMEPSADEDEEEHAATAPRPRRHSRARPPIVSRAQL